MKTHLRNRVEAIIKDINEHKCSNIAVPEEIELIFQAAGLGNSNGTMVNVFITKPFQNKESFCTIKTSFSSAGFSFPTRILDCEFPIWEAQKWRMERELSSIRELGLNKEKTSSSTQQINGIQKELEMNAVGSSHS